MATVLTVRATTAKVATLRHAPAIALARAPLAPSDAGESAAGAG